MQSDVLNRCIEALWAARPMC